MPTVTTPGGTLYAGRTTGINPIGTTLGPNLTDNGNLLNIQYSQNMQCGLLIGGTTGTFMEIDGRVAAGTVLFKITDTACTLMGQVVVWENANPNDVMTYSGGAWGPAAGGGGASAQLPAWTFTAGGGTPSAGHFTTDSDSSQSGVSVIHLHKTDSGGTDLTFLINRLWCNNGYLIFTSSGGVTAAYVFSASTDVGVSNNLTVASVSAQNVAWSGKYYVSYIPAPFASFSGDVTPVTEVVTISGLVSSVS